MADDPLASLRGTGLHNKIVNAAKQGEDGRKVLAVARHFEGEAMAIMSLGDFDINQVVNGVLNAIGRAVYNQTDGSPEAAVDLQGMLRVTADAMPDTFKAWKIEEEDSGRG